MSCLIYARMRNVANKVAEKVKSHNLYSNFFFRKSCLLWDNVERYCREATDDYMEHARCMLDTYGYRHTLIMCHTYFFTTVTMVTRTRDSMLRYKYIACIFYIYNNFKKKRRVHCCFTF